LKSLNQRIESHLKESQHYSMPKVLIATPTADGRAPIGYVDSLVRATALLERNGVETTFLTARHYNIVHQRDRIAHLFLEGDCTHLWFIDSDMQFSSDAGLRLLAFQKEVVGAAYMRRSLNFERMERRLARGNSFEQAFAGAHDPTVSVIDPASVNIDAAGLCEVKALGGGLVMIRRDCFERIAAKVVLTKVPRHYGKPGGEKMLSYFEPIENESGLVSEDHSFCARWRQAGGQVWAWVDADVHHIGDFPYGVSFRQLLEAVASTKTEGLRGS
jgi:hypothetical protein